ncbi:MAG: asparagine synthase (glutamine-hydrolyzing) [Rhodospirillales bacterium]|nr:asparagine synthase (glutamine-hydrolyzing) [Rhodospirillales bacterium]
MCGIWTSLGLTPGKSVINAVAHRGPDGEGWRQTETHKGPLVMAHRRLAVIDTGDTGAQPMSYAERRYWLVFNGMIYNHVELRDELAGLGHHFRGHSDTEVLLAAYAQWGEAALHRLNGMFAFVVWDSQRRTLFAARDRYGVKPLFWINDDRGVAFASEIKQFTALEGFEAKLNSARAYDFLTFAITDHHSETLFDGVRQLLGGECVTLELDKWRPGASFEVRTWYKKPQPGTLDMAPQEASRTLYELLEDSVKLRLRSDVTVGFGLSGGLDSSAIVGLANRQDDIERATVSACYDDPSVDERQFINMVNAEAHVTPVQVFPDGQELVRDLDQLVWHMDGPFTSTSMFAQWSVFKAARQAGVKVMLGGQGADEQLCGYHSAFAPFHAGLMCNFELGRLLKESSAERARHGTSALWQAAGLGAALLPGTLRNIIRHLRRTHHPDWLKDNFSQAFKSPLSKISRLDDLISAQMFETGLPMLLRYEDRNSMAHGIESRLPFLDHRVVELTVGLGSRHKIVDGETKWLLRRAMDGVIPNAIRDRQDKIGFATPERAWLAGPAKALVERGTQEAIERFPDLFDASRINSLRKEVLSGQRSFDFTLWRIICFASWGRVFDVK